MGLYVVERHLPGISSADLQAATVRANTCGSQMTDEGTPVRWIRSSFLPETERCYCTFEAPNQKAVAEVNERARIPFIQIHSAMELNAEGS